MVGHSTSVTLVVTVEDVAAEPHGWLFRAMLRGADRDVDVIGPSFVVSAEELRAELADACDEFVAFLHLG